MFTGTLFLLIKELTKIITLIYRGYFLNSDYKFEKENY